MFLFALAACSTTHGVRPLGAGRVAFEGSLGGPIVELFGAPVPLPLSTVGVGVGLDDKTDVHGAVHPTALGLFRVAGAEAGASRELFGPKGARPRLMADLTVLGFGGDAAAGGAEGGFRLFLQPTLTASWDWGKDARHVGYVALTDFFQPFPTIEAPGAFALGHGWGLSPDTAIVTELKWISPWEDSDPVAPHWYAPATQGAVSFQLGLRARFGGAK